MKKNEKLFEAMSGFDDDLIAAAAPKERKRKAILGKKWLTAPVAAAMAAVLTLGVAAAGTAVVMRILNEPVITENNTRLTEVPEGYVGIYSVADLMQMAEDVKNDTCAENYILMEDITFTDADYEAGGICEGGWEPIQIQHRHYHTLETTVKEDGTISVNSGKEIPCTVEDITSNYSETGEYSYGYSTHVGTLKRFNGNGHVIRNLKIRETVVADQFDDPYYIGLFGNAGQTIEGAQIINLGIEGLDIVVSGTPDTEVEQITVGGVAAVANYIGACYVKDMTVTLDLDGVKKMTDFEGGANWPRATHLLVGGVAGQVDCADACYAENYNMTVSADGQENVHLNGGGIAARVQTAVTCWSQGQWDVTGNAYVSSYYGEIIPESNHLTVPPLIPGPSFDQMMETVWAHYGEDAFEAKKILAYFVKFSPVEETPPTREDDAEWWPDYLEECRATYERNIATFNKMYALTAEGDVEYYDTFWFYDPWASGAETADIYQLLVEAYGNAETFEAFCEQCTMKTGAVYCAAPTGKVETDYQNFDFTSLWILRNGIPRLRIFE